MSLQKDVFSYINEVAPSHGFKENERWSLDKEFKRNNLDFYILSNYSDSSTVVVSKNRLDEFEIVFIDKHFKIDSHVISTLNSQKLLMEVAKIGCKEVDKSDLKFPDELINAAINDDNELFESLFHKNNIGYNHINFLDDFGYMEYKIPFIGDISSAKIGVLYDKENFEIEFKSYDGVSFLEIRTGGDWEHPITAFAYWSESEGRIVGYFPKWNGNTYNLETDTAYGSEHDSNLLRKYHREDPVYIELMSKFESKNHYDIKESKIIEIGKKQFLNYIAKKENSPTLKLKI